MKKQNKLVVWLKYLPVAVIFMLGLLNANKFIYAQTPSPTGIPTPSISNTVSQNQVSSSVEAKKDSAWEPINAVGTLLSGIAAIIAIIKSNNADKQSKETQERQIITKNIVNNNFDSLIKQTEDPKEKQRLLEQKKVFEDELRGLAKKSGASKKAEIWLKANRERLAQEAAWYTVANKSSVGKDVRDKFYSHLNDYLYGIEKSLFQIGDTDYIDELVTDLVSQHVLESSDYKKALQFINDKINESKLSPDSREEIKYYFNYLIDSLP